MRLENRVAIVTGGGSGIGKAISLRFAEEGAKVVVGDIDSENAINVAREIQSNGGESISHKVDVSLRENVVELINTTVDSFKKLDIMVASAGLSEICPSEELSSEKWKRMIDVNLTGLFYCCQLAGKEMKKNGSGKIVNISSASGVRGEQDNVHYVAAKHGVVGITRALALDFAKYNINVNCVCPAFTLTPATLRQSSKEEINRRVKFIPLGRTGKPEEQANAALFLASSESDFITGNALYVDGGLLAGKYFLNESL